MNTWQLSSLALVAMFFTAAPLQARLSVTVSAVSVTQDPVCDVTVEATVDATFDTVPKGSGSSTCTNAANIDGVEGAQSRSTTQSVQFDASRSVSVTAADDRGHTVELQDRGGIYSGSLPVGLVGQVTTVTVTATVTQEITRNFSTFRAYYSEPDCQGSVVSSGGFGGSDGGRQDAESEPVTASYTAAPDSQPPTLSAATDLTASTSADQCTASVSFTPPTASDNCGGAPTVVGALADGTVISSPYVFPLGDTVVTWTATDAAGNRSTSSQQTVTVLDSSLPTITAPGDVDVDAEAGQCTASNVDLGTPTTGDNCGVKGVTTDAPAIFPLGKTTVTWTVTDNSGNAATGRQIVTVTDAEAPTIQCPPYKIVSVDAGACTASVPVDRPTVSDNCSKLSSPTGRRSDGLALDAPYPAGTTTITWSIADAAGNRATCKQDVTVRYAWSGVLQPINADGSSVFKRGSTIPVRFTLFSACAGSLVATLGYTQVSSSVAGPVNKTGSTSTPTSGNQFRYDPKSGQYIFNWGTKGLAPGTYQLQINLGNSVTYSVQLGLR